MSSPGGLSYAAAGVDVAAGERSVELMRDAVKRTSRPEVVGGLGGFAGLFALDTTRYRKPLLASSTDGVGTKLAIAQAMGVHDTIGIDLIGMVVDDLVVCGAEPLFVQDYIACGRLVPEKIAQIVSGVAEGCVQAGCALVGGETAEHADLMGADDYDLAGTGVGVVEADDVLGAERVRADDVLVAMGSSGLHSNGFVLARRVLLAHAGLALDAEPADLDRPLGVELLEPTRIYAQHCLAVARDLPVRVFSHVTGGGLAANLARVLPAGLTADLDRATWTPQPIFGLIAARGDVAAAEMERTFNMGVGMIAVVAPEAADATVRLLRERGLLAWIVGGVRTSEDAEAPGAAELHGVHRS